MVGCSSPVRGFAGSLPLRLHVFWQLARCEFFVEDVMANPGCLSCNRFFEFIPCPLSSTRNGMTGPILRPGASRYEVTVDLQCEIHIAEHLLNHPLACDQMR